MNKFKLDNDYYNQIIGYNNISLQHKNDNQFGNNLFENNENTYTILATHNFDSVRLGYIYNRYAKQKLFDLIPIFRHQNFFRKEIKSIIIEIQKFFIFCVCVNV